ncbi:catalase family protein [Alienimonas californiensis]|uniref:Catalase n=1 Tax=Alienimonas californiensis TaxID=2527989 RepID=A0A517PBK5_9PLAN|nr:catalase [Alienimonas californiensis]QDT16749.1 Catalase [Alienimonas californiensis]
MIENIPADESDQIDAIVDSTLRQLEIRYPGDERALRAVHAKGHACVRATFKVADELDARYRIGVFATPGIGFDTDIRFSNAAVLVTPDSPDSERGRSHGSRGVALKLHDVIGPRLREEGESDTQDFLMINQPVFAFANVEDYAALSAALERDTETRASNGAGFFSRMPDGTSPPTPLQKRAARTFDIIGRIRSFTAETPENKEDGKPKAFQAPPASPVDNTYFGAAPFQLGENQVMRFRLKPAARSNDLPNVESEDYLREALARRLADTAAGDVIFEFGAQVRSMNELAPDVDIEDASEQWPETIPFVHLATVTIPCQQFSADGQREACEALVFNPWNGLEAHRPLGGINRLRKPVYDASVSARCPHYSRRNVSECPDRQ